MRKRVGAMSSGLAFCVNCFQHAHLTQTEMKKLQHEELESGISVCSFVAREFLS